jgi:hypothetical protein
VTCPTSWRYRFPEVCRFLHITGECKSRLDTVASAAGGQFWQGAAAPITSSALVNDNQWHHVALNASDGSQTVYLDGAFVGRLDTGAIDNDPFPDRPDRCGGDRASF